MLTDVAIRNAKPKEKQYKLTDSQGLYLLIHPNGSKYWRYKYNFENKEKLLSLGVYPTIGLSDARQKHIDAKRQLADGTDPSAAKKRKKQERIENSENTFESIAKEWHESRLPSWTPKHAHNVMRRMEADLFPRIGKQPIRNINASDVLTVIRAIEARGATDIAHRALQMSRAVFTYAVATGRADNNPAAELKGALKAHKPKHYAYLKEDELPEFLHSLNNYDGHILTRLALKLLLLTFVRTTELRGAEWKEIDLKKKEWRIPAGRMKMRTEHVVPLSKQAFAILTELETLSGDGPYVFPHSTKPNKIMSNNTMLYALYRMGYHNRTTAHGFRALASTILNEQGFRPDVIERQLAHAERNKVRASYNHAQYLPERREMMQHWADYLDSKQGQ